MGRRRCCCEGRACDIFTGDFTSDTLAADFVDESGSWSIDTTPGLTHLEESGNADATLRIRIDHPVNSVMGQLYAVLKNVLTGSNILLLANYLDSSNYLYGRIEYTAGNSVTLSVGKCTGGVETDLETNTVTGPPSSGADGEYTLCYGPTETDGEILLSLACTSYPVAVAHVRVYDKPTFHVGGKYAGVANRAAVEIQIENLWWDEHRISNKLGDCWWCMCTCRDEALHLDTIIPKTLTATVVNVDGCEALDGQEFTLEYDEAAGIYGDFFWTSGEWFCDAAEEVRLAPQLACTRTDCGDPVERCEKTSLTCDPGLLEPCTYDSVITANASSTCRPINLVFGPYVLTDHGGTCDCCDPVEGSSFNIVITE